MTRTRLVIARFILLGVFGLSPAFGQVEHQTFKISTSPYFARPREVLKRLVVQKGHQKKNHFCVVGYGLPDGGRNAWVYWKEGHAIILWEGLTEGTFDLAHSKRYFRIPRDVVANESQIRGSNSLVTRRWTEQLMKECEREGESFLIDR